MPDITHERLLECLDYNPESGDFIWKKSSPRGADIRGRRAGSVGTNGYVRIRVDGQHYSAHRLAWIFTHGSISTMSIDHINGIKTDNRIANLRYATRQQNGMNTGMPATNSTGHKNVSRNRGGYLVTVKSEGRVFSKWFKDLSDAANCARTLRGEKHGVFANDGVLPSQSSEARP